MEALELFLQWEGMPSTNIIKRIQQSIGRSHPWAIDRIDCATDYLATSKIEVRCMKEYSADSKVELLDAVNVYRYPSVYSEVLLEGYETNAVVRPVCYFENEAFWDTEFDEWVYILGGDGSEGWVLEKYVLVEES